jgi:hypothetical protein
VKIANTRARTQSGARFCTKALIREIKRTHAAPLMKITSARVLNRCNRVIVTIAIPRMTTPDETIISVEKRARSVCMRRAPPIAPAPKHPSNSPYPIALSSTLLATGGSNANSELEKNRIDTRPD